MLDYKAGETIAFLCHPYHRGGVTSWMVNAAHAVASMGYKVYFITVNPRKPFISSGNRPSIINHFKTLFKESRVEFISTYVGFEFELGTLPYKSLVYSKLIQKNIPKGSKLILADEESLWMGASFLASDYQIIGVLHSDDPKYYDLFKKYKSYVSNFTSVSNRIIRKLPNSHDISIPVIPCGIYLKRELPIIKSDNKLVIAWVGRVDEYQKRISDVPKISQMMLAAGNNNFVIHVVGHGSESEWLLKKIVELNLSDFIILHGWQEAHYVEDILGQSHVLLQTSNFEGMSVAVMEALDLGCVIVSTKVSGVEDFESDKSAEGIIHLYDVGNCHKAVEILINLKYDNEICQRARALARNKYNIYDCMRQYLELPNNRVLSSMSKTNIFSVIKSLILAFIRLQKYKLISSKLPSQK